MKKEILNENVNTVMDEQQMQQYVERNIHMVPKNQCKKFETLTLEQKAKKIQFYFDIEKLKADAKIKNSVLNRVKEIFDKLIEEQKNRIRRECVKRVDIDKDGDKSTGKIIEIYMIDGTKHTIHMYKKGFDFISNIIYKNK